MGRHNLTPLDLVDRNRKADSRDLPAGVVCLDSRHNDSNDLTRGIQQRASRVARIDGGVRLEVVKTSG